MKLIQKELRRQAFTLIYLFCIVLLVVSWYKNFEGITSEEIQKTQGNESTTELIE